jgi:hypothetical protein
MDSLASRRSTGHDPRWRSPLPDDAPRCPDGHVARTAIGSTSAGAGRLHVQVLAGFMASACRQGGKSVSAYRDQPGGQGSDALCEVMIDSAASLGWGRWAFRRDGQALMLEVVNSPFAAGHGPSNHAVCAPIAGIFQSLASMVLACDAEVNELACAAQGCQVCHFIAVPTTTADRTVATSKVASAA